MINDDLRQLQQMMTDMEHAPACWQTTNYWKFYQRMFLPTVYKEGISQFRCSKNPAYSSFGVSHLPTFVQTQSVRDHIFLQIEKALTRLFPRSLRLKEIALQQFSLVRRLSYEYALSHDKDLKVRTISDSGPGGPDDLFEIGGQKYTIAFLSKFMQYLYVKKFFQVQDCRVVWEVGGGYGVQAEVLLKLHPEIHLILVDIPPQIYVAQQYLEAVFQGLVANYSSTRNLTSIGPEAFGDGRILILCPWQVPNLNVPCDLFWNSASFQEMEPDVVGLYLGHVERLASKAAYLRQIPEGKELASGPGKFGVLARTTIEHYKAGLPSFDLVDISPAEFLPDLAKPSYKDMFFLRRRK